MIFSFTWLKEQNPDINWQTAKIKWWQPEGDEECMHPSNRACVNEPSKETTWTKPLASKPSCANYMEYWKATIEEESDTKEWMDSSDEPSVNGPFSNDLDNFNNITIWYIGTDASLMELHTELLINATLKPLDTRSWLENTLRIYFESRFWLVNQNIFFIYSPIT